MIKVGGSNNDHFADQYMRYVHLKNFHAAPKTLVALSRLQFWIVNARNVARRIVRLCVHCVRFRLVLLNQFLGQLPKDRVIPSRPFSTRRIDFCGPVYIYMRIRGKPSSKAYIAVFVCFVIKAIHIGLV